MKIDLIKNFRSRQEVVDAVNLVFSPLMSLARGGANYKKDHIMYFGNTNYNEVFRTIVNATHIIPNW